MTFTANNTKRLTANALKESITAYLTSRDPLDINRINAALPNYVGLYSINRFGIQKLRREKINRHVQKSEMLISIPSAAVKSEFSVKGKLSSDEIRSVVLRKSIKEIHSYFISYFSEKLESTSHISQKKIPERNETPEDYIII